jgi:hypothetical protein
MAWKAATLAGILHRGRVSGRSTGGARTAIASSGPGEKGSVGIRWVATGQDGDGRLPGAFSFLKNPALALGLFSGREKVPAASSSGKPPTGMSHLAKRRQPLAFDDSLTGAQG